MKVQCDFCQRAEAVMICCADEAALCCSCDEEIHAANKLASKHQRVPLIHQMPSKAPKCDICQEKVGYFFCLEDRALLCHGCDVSVHTATPYVTSHQRFLVTGVRVALHHLAVPNPPYSADLSSNPSSGSAASEASAAAVAARVETVAAPAAVEELQWPWLEEAFPSGELDGRYFDYCDFGGQ